VSANKTVDAGSTRRRFFKLFFVTIPDIAGAVLPFADADAARKGSKRVGGTNSKGKGSRYVGGR
jgi:hypothetical protein